MDGCLVFVCFFIGWGSCYRLSERDSHQIAVETNSDDKHLITITKKRSPEIIINGELEAWAVGDNVPYIIHFNGGEGNGGWNDVIPARNDPERHRFKPTFHPGKGITASFSIQLNATINSAQIAYSIKRL